MAAGVTVLAVITLGSASQGTASVQAIAQQAPRQTCDRPMPTTFRKVNRWGCFSMSMTVAWQASLVSPPTVPCRGAAHLSLRWSGTGGTYWIGDDMTTRRAWDGAPSRWALGNIIMVGPAAFNVRFSGQLPQGGTCVPAETLDQGCGVRTIPKYAAGIVPIIGLGARGEYSWNPAEYSPTQKPPDYSACGGPGLQFHVQPPWVTEGRYEALAGFTLSSVAPVPGSGNTRARAKKVAAERFMSTRVGRTLVLRAQDRPRSNVPGSHEGSWTATIRARRIK